MGAAWRVVERMREKGFCLKIEWESEENCLCEFDDDTEGWARHKLPARAICLAACAALGIEVKQGR